MSNSEPNNTNEGQSRAGEAGANLTVGLGAGGGEGFTNCGATGGGAVKRTPLDTSLENARIAWGRA